MNNKDDEDLYIADGSWGNDPLDLRCIRIDAEMEQGLFSSEEVWTPNTLQDCYSEEFEKYTLCCTSPPSRFLKKPIFTFIIDNMDMIVDRYVHDPYVAIERINELAKENKSSIEDYRIFIAREKKFISFEEAKKYE